MHGVWGGERENEVKKQFVAFVSCADTDTDTEGSDSEASDAASVDSDIAQEQEKSYDR